MEGEVAQFLDVRTVDEYVDFREQVVRRLVVARLEFFERVARVAPDVEACRVDFSGEFGERCSLQEGLAAAERHARQQRVQAYLLQERGERLLVAAFERLRLRILAVRAAALATLHEDREAEAVAVDNRVFDEASDVQRII